MTDEMKDVALEILAEQTERDKEKTKKDLSESLQYCEMGFINGWGLATFGSTTVIIYPRTFSNNVSASVLRRIAMYQEEGYELVERYHRGDYNYMVFTDVKVS